MKKTVKKAQAHPAITKHHGTVKRALKVQALEVIQGDETLYTFKAPASTLFQSLGIQGI